jgi:methionyl-tRNA formyltransferase
MEYTCVFMGSPEFACATLRALARVYPLKGVVTQPDKPAGRGQVLTPPPVKVVAGALGLPVIQPKRLREPEALAALREWNPDFIVVAAFGQILRPDVLDLPRFGCINVHASLLPRWRGASPIQAAILHGDRETGVSIMRLDPGMDTGPVLSRRATAILPTDTAGTLGERLAELGAGLLLETLPAYLAGSLLPVAQDASLATAVSMIQKGDGQLDFSQPAAVLARQVMAYNPWPGAFTTWQNQVFKVLRAHARPMDGALPGAEYHIDGLPAWGTAQGLLVLDEVQPAGKKPMGGDVFLRGARQWARHP